MKHEEGMGAVLDYARPAVREVPLVEIAGAAFVFAAAHLLVDGMATYWVMVGGREYSSSPGLAAAQRDLRVGKFVSSMAVEVGLMMWAWIIVVGTQCLAWRLWPAERVRRVWPWAVGAGVVYCGAGWGVWMMRETVAGLGSTEAQIVAALLAAAGAGVFLAWRRAG